ncbi:MAG TPA: RNA-binding transcriptional accessory protein [Candidatus Alectryocaccomicrobium excrementavium]|uniref:RNA-binding transcriptional accessory protein n=1 Tax=Candidatus Alectryocaccomicrobium excrementavium TaxID=2840668 RepID=A0A9D1K5Q7_9FIRM|nr:RNA-binding transcriptional accessory protein [Candidatus Alectryocaccomicrobium excrementavium]
MEAAKILATEFKIQSWQAEAVIRLLDEGNTLPFIARYRKEQHGELDDQKLREIAERLAQLRALEARREEIAASLQKLEVWTEELQRALDAAGTMGELEDIYRPYRPKRRTRAMIAREKGLEPLCDILQLQAEKRKPPEELAAPFLSAEKGVESEQAALAGAMDILAERVSDDARVRAKLKALYLRTAQVRTRAAKEEDSVYRMYYEHQEPMRLMASHRVLAVNRGEAEGFLKVSLEVDAQQAENEVCALYVRPGSTTTPLVEAAARDAYSRLIAPSLENELRGDLTERAQEAAIRVFALNLKPLLMQPPVRGKVAIGLDPGIRTGCKVAVVDATGRVLDTAVIYPLPSHGKVEQAKKTVEALIRRHGVSVVAIGNGTASRETEQFFVDVMREMSLGSGLSYMVVSEAGASVYSASKLAAEEFPQFDVSLRSAVSIARRLQDPLAELVKIDPKAIGVGQYQHDLKEARLDEALAGVVEDCVNAVGVDVNTASPSLLSHVAGINAAVAKNIVAYREENGAFASRAALKKVPKLGPKAFEQCAGFLRVPGGKDPMENTGVHPESYAAAKALLKLCGCSLEDAQKGLLRLKAEEKGYKNLAEQTGAGEPTLRDIVKELEKPGRDPRDELPPPLLRTDVLDMDDLVEGMELKGTVRNVTDFGAFVDIGVHRDGLVHISQLSGRRVRHPSEVISVGDVVTVWVLSVEKDKNRISLTMRKPVGAP